MNNNNLFIGLVLGFILGNDTTRTFMLNMSGKMLEDVSKDLKPKVNELKNTILKGDNSNDGYKKDTI